MIVRQPASPRALALSDAAGARWRERGALKILRDGRSITPPAR